MLTRILTAAVLALAASVSQAQSFPSQPLKVYMPGAPGGSFDTLTRLVVNELQEALKQPVVVENFAGAGGMVAVERCLAGRADGHHLCGTYAGNLAIAPFIFPKMAYDPGKDVKPVALLGSVAFVLAVPASSPYRTVQELLAAARANPGKISYASGGNGTGGHVGGEMIKSATNLQMTHVPYQGAAPASVALLGGHVDWSFEALPTSLANIRAGKLRVLAVSTLKRQPDLPDVPTMAEAGLPGFELTSWFALSAPAGTPDPVIAQLNSAINRVLETPKVKDAYAARGAQTLGGTPEQFASFLQSESRLYGRVMRNAKVE
jgi:tripartite-type tricarboxylate transporter receptor subunit TctC